MDGLQDFSWQTTISREHIKKETNVDETQGGIKKKRFICDFCSYTTKKLSRLEKHQLTEHENENVKSSASSIAKKGSSKKRSKSRSRDSCALSKNDQLTEPENVGLANIGVSLKSKKKRRRSRSRSSDQVSAPKIRKSDEEDHQIKTEVPVQEFTRQSNEHISGPGSNETGIMRESVKKKKQKKKCRDGVTIENCAFSLKLMETQNLIEPSPENDDTKIFIFKCSSCEFATDSKRRFVRHRAKHAFYCTECDFSADIARTVQEHFSREHKPRGKYNCPECDHTNDFSWGLKMHMKTHSSEKSLFCEFCNFSTRWPFALKRHIACTHPIDDSKSFQCNHCAYSTNSRSDLKRHTRVHSTLKPYSCSVCPYRCKSAEGLRKHIVVHIKDKKYACDLCEFRCTGMANLTGHIKRVHSDSDDKPYKCSDCSYSCHHESHLRKHAVIHLENRPSYKCSCCEKAFTRRYVCRQHEFKCAGIAAYTCTVCNEGFMKQKYLRKHIVIHSSL